jgi:N-methylhydantoinase B
MAPDTSVTSMFERRLVPPYGLQGGEPGAPFRVTVKTVDGRAFELPGKTNIRLDAGDLVIVESCGGGGYGAPGHVVERDEEGERET